MDFHKKSSSAPTPHLKERSYNEIVEYLDAQWSAPKDTTLATIRHLDATLEHPSKQMHTIAIGGVNGKSITAYFTGRLLNEEGLKVGILYAPHIKNYNERINYNGVTISNKEFTQVANEVIHEAESASINAHTSELLTLIALQYFKKKKVNVAILETFNDGTIDPITLCNIAVAGITRIPEGDLNHIMHIVQKDTWVVTADQQKVNITAMATITKKLEGKWIMPVRKPVKLAYPYEQIHGRCAALAERIAFLYMDKLVVNGDTIIYGSLLVKRRGKRGRPTTEVKKKLEKQATKTLEEFWKQTICELPGRFQVIAHENPSVILDAAGNVDALENLFLGVRLLHYQKHIKGIGLIIGATPETIKKESFLKSIRYIFKKVPGHVYLCPISEPLPGLNEDQPADLATITNDIKSMQVNATACKNFEEAMALAKETIDKRDGFIVVTGSHSIIHEYLIHKGVKKLS